MASETAEPPPITISEGYTLHTENAYYILLPPDNQAFLKPVEEFNHDLSMACIRTWSELLNEEKQAKWQQSQERQAKKKENGCGPKPKQVKKRGVKCPMHHPCRSVILEALSATGLHSIHYAKEICHRESRITNDYSPATINGLADNTETIEAGSSETPKRQGSKPVPPKVRHHPSALMYDYRTERACVDVVDLDPYGAAAPFIDAVVQCMNDGGLVCVTCMNLSVLATLNYLEKWCALLCASSSSGALRLVLHTILTSIARYGRYIQPLLSLSIDFYVHLFVRIYTSANEVTKAFSGNINYHFKAHAGLTVTGPMWSGSIHDPAFISKVLEHIEASNDKYGTSARMKGMLTVAKEELNTPFYFMPAKIAGTFHCICPALDEVALALLHAGHQISRSHISAGSLKTTATRADVHDVFCYS
ncbi:N2,N2-dimethylguanosine tRNA methyltransferase [Laetiporus sulphureus 93-53]|uniref:tRNA (guanine(26)-N(2))-dimethyltransferase n=1 Tax=Laetiporus sulphureus 93-53 TaxID=1314785 RepID=A0A165AXC0_9APHY|nr:N2,N2-dimethylguanosine tRNA methyltransferase [Laetiporus sulphureus 93-53]KZS99834.1 N2,N2-dimethylguanosine tRNA methyltransferase [Laetiporus sulphureus 93-53]